MEVDIDRAPGRMRKSVLGVLFATVLMATLATFLGAQHYFHRLETNNASGRMVLYLRALNETLRQHQHLPFVLAGDPRYSQALQSPAIGPELNIRLRSLAQEAKLEAIYLMNADGRVVATSNADEPHSFLGQNYGFRPYFKEALRGQRSDYFAIGATSGRPGYFVAERVSPGPESGDGVIAIKLDMSELQRSWENNSETVVTLNQDGIVVLSSNPDWLYRPVRALSPAQRNAIAESRQFGTEPLAPLDWTPLDPGHVAVEGTSYLQASGSSEWRGWAVHYLQPEAVILRQTLLTTALFGFIITFLLAFATFLRSRRIELAYAASERRRTDLIETNRQLKEAQSELARSTKLAALGHLAASVTHELGQPISAFRNHLVAAEMNNEIKSQQTAISLHNLVQRMDDITGQFRFFVRGQVDKKLDVDLLDVLNGVADLLRSDLDGRRIDYETAGLRAGLVLNGHQIQLEQVFTNLVKNAMDAVEGVPDPTIKVAVSARPGTVEIRVSDNGHGLDDATLSDLQEPFFSTKPSGIGMGLGLAIVTEIIKDHGGTLKIGEAEVGAVFVVSLPLKTREVVA